MKNKKLLCIISMILTFITLLSIPSFALTTAVVKESNGMNMRKGAGTSYEKIVVVPNKTSVVINGRSKCTDGSTTGDWYNVTCKIKGKEYTGYIASSGISNVKNDSALDGTYTEGVSSAIPDIYLTAINKLKKQHPNWTFKFFYTGLDWYDVIKNETKPKANSIEGSSYPVSYRSTTVYFNASSDYAPGDQSVGIINGSDGSLNMRDGPGTTHKLVASLSNGTKVKILSTVNCDDGTTSGTWYKISVKINGADKVGYVASNRVTIPSASGSFSFTPVEGSNWYQAHGQVVSYFIDPRNFLNESNIFQFEELTYNSSVQTLNGVKAILKGSFMDSKSITTDSGKSITYAEAFMEAGKKYNVSPYHLASKVLQEVGRNGSKSVTGDNPNYPVYNFYNIGANSGYLDGLRWAYNSNKPGSYGRPWTTQYKSIIGGAEFISAGYISKGQNTTYFEKFDFIVEGGMYQHQYAADVTYAKVQSNNTYKKVYKDILSTDFCFIIPVFRNMPKDVCQLPNASSQPNMAKDCPKLTNTVDPKPTDSSGDVVTPNPSPSPSPSPAPKPPVHDIPITIVTSPDCGDVNRDGKITVVDAKQTLKYLSGERNDKFSVENADINGDGNITVVDAKWMLQVVAGMRDLKVVKSDAQSAIELVTSYYSFAMPEGWEYSSNALAFYKKNTDNNCFVRVDCAGEQNNEYKFTLENIYNQSLAEMKESAQMLNDGSENTANVTDGSFVLKNGGNEVKYCHYVVCDKKNNVVDSQYFACLLIGKQIYCISYYCNDGKGYDADFDFSKQIEEYFKVK